MANDFFPVTAPLSETHAPHWPPKWEMPEPPPGLHSPEVHADIARDDYDTGGH